MIELFIFPPLFQNISDVVKSRMSSDDHYSIAPLYSILTARDNDLAVSVYERHKQMSF